MNQKIILASASPRRRELLAQIGLEFEVKVSNKEEVYTSTKPQKIVEELALMKAENVASDLQAEGVELKNTIVIGADTIVVRDEEILGKPKNEDHANDSRTFFFSELYPTVLEVHMYILYLLTYLPPSSELRV